MKIYNQFKINSIDYSSLLSNQFLIYEYLISSLIKISKIDKATKILDEIFISLRKNPEIFDKVAQRLISCYLLEISYKDLNKAEEIFLKFDSIPWLPDFTVSSQLNIIKNCILFNQFKLINFFWDYTVIRDDFDKGATTKSSHNSTNIGTNHLTDLLIYETSRVENMNIFTDLLALAFKNQHELNPLKFLKESTLKKSLVINDEEVLIKSLVYLLNFENSDNFILSFIIDQGYKSKLSKNQYLSLVVDYIPPKLYTKFISSEFFKQCCDDYKLIDDNIYGIYKIFNYIWGFQPITPDVKLETEIMKKLRHYYRILFSEMDDLINYYVEIPDQLKEFKSILKQKLNA
ncbi:hypothetical protein PACTADRAFT_49016 [Pachysolen tannophilus NRRL Y-2460]|uniref:Uncharacterized protein n=1 Tax=Pachysolen tannophilus NRRL Y-2460 TaxID=669874 RepID=A0A1E4TZU5_PACTA|nr:hypothetical protein PACTADRAFT_49016 [Pachysolen tannophilus NRRL Y-2460]